MLQEKHPSLVVVPLNTAFEQKRKYTLEEFRVISIEDWFMYLECLPPMNWCRAKNSESFYVSELIFDNIATHLCRINDDHYLFHGTTDMTHADVLNRVATELEKLNVESMADAVKTTASPEPRCEV